MAKFKQSRNSDNSNDTNKKKQSTKPFANNTNSKYTNQDSQNDNSQNTIGSGAYQEQNKETANKIMQNLKKFAHNKKLSIPTAIIALSLLGYGTYNSVLKPDPVKTQLAKTAKQTKNDFARDKFDGKLDQDARTPAKQESSGISNELATDTDPDYFSQNQVYKYTFLSSGMGKDLNSMSKKDSANVMRTGELTYISNRNDVTSLNIEDNQKPNISARKLSTQPLYGFAAFKDTNTDKWVRIPFIQPIPKIDAKYGNYGGMSEDKAKQEIKSRHQKADKIYNNALEKQSNSTLRNGSDVIDSIDSDPQGSLDTVSSKLQKQAPSFAQPLGYYMRDTFNLPLTSSQADRVDKDNKINVLNRNYYGLINTSATKSLNSVAQEIVPTMLSNWGLNTDHSIYLYNDNSYIVIDGYAYDYSNVVLDLYDNPDGDTSGKTNILDQNNNEPQSKQYITKLYTSK